MHVVGWESRKKRTLTVTIMIKHPWMIVLHLKSLLRDGYRDIGEKSLIVETLWSGGLKITTEKDAKTKQQITGCIAVAVVGFLWLLGMSGNEARLSRCVRLEREIRDHIDAGRNMFLDRSFTNTMVEYGGVDCS